MVTSGSFSVASADVTARKAAQREAQRLHRRFAHANTQLLRMMEKHPDAFFRPDKNAPFTVHAADERVNALMSRMVGVVRAIHNKIGDSLDVTTQNYYRAACAQTRGLVGRHIVDGHYFGANDANFKVLTGSYRISPFMKNASDDTFQPSRQVQAAMPRAKNPLQPAA